MMALPLLKLDAKKDPRALLRLFVTCSILSIFLVLLLAGYGFWEVLQGYVTSSAEDDAINVSRALLSEERERIVVSRQDGKPVIEIRGDDMAQLDRHLRSFLAPFSIVKIKIYSSDCRIIYSTETRLIGEVDAHNARLRNALAGHYDSKLENKEEVRDLADEVKFNVDVVETYIPILDRQNRVSGSFEIYMDVTKYREQSKQAMVLFEGILALILFLGFGFSFPFIRKGTKDIKEIQEMLRKLSITDFLTGIYNKREIVQIAQREFARALRRREKKQPEVDLGFIMLDVDRFKDVNDTYGHLAGDALLKQLTDRISDSLRMYDTVGRFGGEEFMVVLPGADLEQTRTVAQKIWRLVREEPFDVDGEELSVTVSLGISTCREEDRDFAVVVKRADEALYRSKTNGRDRIEIL